MMIKPVFLLRPKKRHLKKSDDANKAAPNGEDRRTWQYAELIETCPYQRERIRFIFGTTRVPIENSPSFQKRSFWLDEMRKTCIARKTVFTFVCFCCRDAMQTKKNTSCHGEEGVKTRGGGLRGQGSCSTATVVLHLTRCRNGAPAILLQGIGG